MARRVARSRKASFVHDSRIIVSIRTRHVSRQTVSVRDISATALSGSSSSTWNVDLLSAAQFEPDPVQVNDDPGASDRRSLGRRHLRALAAVAAHRWPWAMRIGRSSVPPKTVSVAFAGAWPDHRPIRRGQCEPHLVAGRKYRACVVELNAHLVALSRPPTAQAFRVRHGV